MLEILPAGTAPAPGIVIIPEIFGLSDALREMSQTFVRAGFTIGLYDVYWRSGDRLTFSHSGDGPKQASSHHEALDYDQAAADIGDAAETLRRAPNCNGSVAVVGYCLGGTLAFLAAARCDIDAAVGYYGTRIDKYLDDVAAIDVPLLLHFGAADHFTPPVILSSITDRLAANSYITSHTYAGAQHSFANHTRPTFDAAAAAAANERSVAFLARALKG
jgi:carboxymethylenebutenolidase